MATSAAAFGTPQERIPRAEHQLVDAALAVNEAQTLDEALEALAASARALTFADRVSILQWDAGFRAATVAASSGGHSGHGFRVSPNKLTSSLIAQDIAFVVGPEHLEGPPAEIAERAFAVGTLCVPLSQAGLPTVSFQASWDVPAGAEASELAISKLRLLGRLSSVAFRAEAERTRARDDARLRAVFEAVPDGLVVRFKAGAVLNEAARELLAASGDAIEHMALRELDGTLIPASDTPLKRATRTGEEQSYIVRVRRYDGVERIHEGRIAPVADVDGSTFATVTSFRDVTEAQDEQFVTHQFLERLFEALPIAVAVADPETYEIRRVNQSFVDLLGYEADEAVGARPPYPWWSTEYEILPASEDGRITRYERIFRRKNGELVPAELTRVLVRDPEGRPNAAVVLIADQSERRAFEQQLVQSGKLASIGELAAGVAHEINNPLFAILGLAELLLLDAEPGTKAQGRLELIQSTALEIKEIVRAMLDFARDRSDERFVVSLADIAAQTVDLMRRTNAAKQVEIVERYPDTDVLVEASTNQLKQILVNLISNAKHVLEADGGTITVEVGRDAGVAWAEVRDTGPGISAEVAARIFEPFFTTRREVGGTGLGLSVSLGIAQAHDGSLVVDSTPGEGASFRLSLPLATEEAS